MDLNAIVSNVATLASIASTVAGQTKLGGAIRVAQAGVDLVRELRETAGLTATQVATLETSRDLFEAAVNSHADRTAASLA